MDNGLVIWRRNLLEVAKMTAEVKKSKYLLHVIVMAVITFGFRFLPGPGTVTSYGMAVLGVFLGLVYGWTFLGL